MWLCLPLQPHLQGSDAQHDPQPDWSELPAGTEADQCLLQTPGATAATAVTPTTSGGQEDLGNIGINFLCFIGLMGLI